MGVAGSLEFHKQEGSHAKARLCVKKLNRHEHRYRRYEDVA
jgi:hypothetical protein